MPPGGDLEDGVFRADPGTPGNIQIEQRIVLPDWLVERVLFLVEWCLGTCMKGLLLFVQIVPMDLIEIDCTPLSDSWALCVAVLVS